MKTLDLTVEIEDAIIEKMVEYCKMMLENLEDFYVYENREFTCLNDLDDDYKEWMINELKENKISKVIFDKISKENVEKYRTIIVSEDCKGALIFESTLIGMVHLEYHNIMIIKSRITGTRTRIFLNTLIEDCNLIGCAIALCHIKGSNAFDSNINFAKIGNGTLINSGCFIANGVLIKEGVMVGPKTNLVVNTYEPHRPLEYYAGTTEPENDVLEVGDSVWFGASANIVKSIKIGNWALISGGSQVAQDVPPFTLYIKEKHKSIIDRVKKIADSDELLMRILKGTYPGGHETGVLYVRVKDMVEEWGDPDNDLRLYYAYTHSDFVSEGKRVEAMGMFYEFKYKEYLFEFLTPDSIKLDFDNNQFLIEYKKSYDEIVDLRHEFMKNLFKFTDVKALNETKFSAKITEKMKEKMINMDNLFNGAINGVIEHYGLSVGECKIDMNVLADALK